MGTITLRWVESTLMVGSDSNGHSIVIGRSPDDKSQYIGVKPSDLLLISAASCTAYDVVEILLKQRQPLQDFKIICRGDQQDEPPYKFTHIHIHFIIHGQVDPEKVRKAIQLSEQKYCSVTNTLKSGVTITSDYEII